MAWCSIFLCALHLRCCLKTLKNMVAMAVHHNECKHWSLSSHICSTPRAENSPQHTHNFQSTIASFLFFFRWKRWEIVTHRISYYSSTTNTLLVMWDLLIQKKKSWWADCVHGRNPDMFQCSTCWSLYNLLHCLLGCFWGEWGVCSVFAFPVLVAHLSPIWLPCLHCSH